MGLMSADSGNTWNTGLGGPPAGSAHPGTAMKAVTFADVLLVTVTVLYSDALRREQVPKSSVEASTVIAPLGSWPSKNSCHESGPTSGAVFAAVWPGPSSPAAPAPAVTPATTPAAGAPVTASPCSVADPGRVVGLLGTGDAGTLIVAGSISTGAPPVVTRSMYVAMCLDVKGGGRLLSS